MNKILPYAEADYAVFHKKLTPTKYSILGIRVPQMRKIAKEAQKHIDELLSFPNEYYEVVFIKLTVVSLLPYHRFIQYIDDCVALIDNWAHCDGFKAKCIRKNREDFLPILDRIFDNGGEFYQRYVLVTLLNDYMDERYFPTIERYIQNANQELYYVHMAVAWLVAEILVKHYNYGIALLHKNVLNVSTHNKSIQKAIESYRLTNEQKEYLRSLKIKNKKI
jgi:3-methyladenine DNA glycosylase AlkD